MARYPANDRAFYTGQLIGHADRHAHYRAYQQQRAKLYGGRGAGWTGHEPCGVHVQRHRCVRHGHCRTVLRHGRPAAHGTRLRCRVSYIRRSPCRQSSFSPLTGSLSVRRCARASVPLGLEQIFSTCGSIVAGMYMVQWCSSARARLWSMRFPILF